LHNSRAAAAAAAADGSGAAAAAGSGAAAKAKPFTWDLKKWVEDLKLNKSKAVLDVMMRAAALALFTNPPVSFSNSSDGKKLLLSSACMCLRCEGLRDVNLCWPKQGCPYFVLERKTSKMRAVVPQPPGTPSNKVVKERYVVSPDVHQGAHRLVCHLFCTLASDGMHACHRDSCDAPHYTAWSVEQWSQLSPEHRELWKVNTAVRCLSAKCVSPLCLSWQPQAANASTGSKAKQSPGKKARHKKQKL
jgi:hypothetical protein